MIEGSESGSRSGSVPLTTDPGGPKTYGSGGSVTLLTTADHLKNNISPVEEENIQDAEDEE
jgi:hypothetical protein